MRLSRLLKAPSSRASDGAGHKNYRRQGPKRYVPYIPPQFVVETVKFLQSKNNIKSLLDVIFSPRNPRDKEQDRVTYTRAWERYKEEKRVRSLTTGLSLVATLRLRVSNYRFTQSYWQVHYIKCCFLFSDS